MRLRWPTQITPYRSALPGVGAPGLDISAPELPTKFYFITNFNDNTTGAADARGPNCFSGSARYCWNASQGAGFHKVIVPLIGGYGYVGRVVNSGNFSPLSNVDYLGQCAPGPGLIYRCCALRTSSGGDNIRVWHLASWMGDEASLVPISSGNRDAMNAGNPAQMLTRMAFINCEARFWMDEGSEIGYDGMDGVSWIRGAHYDPLHVPPGFGDPTIPNHHVGDDHGYAQLFAGTHNPAPPATPTIFSDHSLTMQSVYAHSTGRNPLACTQNHSHVNCLNYNHGRPAPGGRGAGFTISDNQFVMTEGGKTQHMNCIGNLAVLGPEQVPTAAQLPCLCSVSGSLPAGSTGHSALNAQIGWLPVASQDDFIEGPAAGYLQQTMRRSSWYDGFGDNYQGVLRAFQNPLRPQVQEALEFATLLRETTGMMPRRRYLYQGALNRVFDQIDMAIRGVPGAFQYINSVSDLPGGTGGWEIMPTVTQIDPLNPTSDYHAPMPLDATRDDILTTGMFSNGFSKRGYTKWRAWAIEQYFYVMGP